jgi:hypothetical protein
MGENQTRTTGHVSNQHEIKEEQQGMCRTSMKSKENNKACVEPA